MIRHIVGSEDREDLLPRPESKSKDIELQPFTEQTNAADPSEEMKRPSSTSDVVHLILDGPDNPSDEPPRFHSEILQRLEDIPRRLSLEIPFKVRVLVILGYYLFWLLILRSTLSSYLGKVPYSTDKGGEKTKILSLACGDEKRIWKGQNDACGLNSRDCSPRSLDIPSELIIRCPALCDIGSITYGAREVGDQTVRYENFYVGGGSDDGDAYTLPYRADSFPCGAAVHAGVVSPIFGGCAKLEFTGPQFHFDSVQPVHSSMSKSTKFDSFFPQSFRSLLWYPLFWLGMLNNVTFDRLAVDRFTLKDIAAMPGSVTTTILLLLLILTGTVIQAHQLWKAGRLRNYIIGYCTLGLSIIGLSHIHGLQLRIHHYIIGLVLIPGTKTRGYTAFLFQGLLLGLIVNGVARWGFASIEETNLSLLRDDSAGRAEPPSFLGYTKKNNSITWTEVEFPTTNKQTEKHPVLYSVLINDVEVYKGPDVSINIAELTKNNTEFGTLLTQAVGYHEEVQVYIRIASLGRKGDQRSGYCDAETMEITQSQLKISR
ncbi:hypothetical protein FOA43_002003 [Brettanomyces nanus]|uniref:LCCL domain-containing protein n=1 Tax=Eeniella nana TaxID=13502 RepID=A0A875RYR0_EENNA|nr:uncharacterized protein FOA43_002003 [Brettanomyces nanus]QPG74671.1 hypothetical protein FOA43_002003 [Brettanomyces nanus]